MNPFGGMISTNVPDNWGGTGQVPSGPISTPTNQIEPEKPVEDATLVTARSAGTDAEGDADQIVSALRGIGATVLTAPHYSASGSIVGVQVVAAVPQKSVDSALAKLKGSGVSQTGKWSVSRSERSERVSGMLSSRIQELKAQESTLLEKYHEDATEVVVVREEIQKLNQAIGASRSRPSSNALIIIGVGVL